MPTLYFGYGSNLWKEQMKLRCPTSEYLGIARLTNYQWIINGRGYANVIQMAPSDQQTPIEASWGLVYLLQPSDEAQLDINEGVPESYTKEYLNVDFWMAEDGGLPDPNRGPESRRMLVYVDRLRVEPDVPKKEYVFRMNKGIEDALRQGIPTKYVDHVLRKFIPNAVDDEAVEEVARKQALLFEEER